MKYHVKEFRLGLWHIMAGNVPVHDGSRDGDDQPLIFADGDTADEACAALNKAQEEPL